MSQVVTDIERRLREAISADRLQRHLEHFSTLFRDSGSEDERRAAEYVAEQVSAFGAKVKILTFDSLISWPLEARLVVTYPDGRSEEIPARPRSFGGVTPPEGIVAEIVFIPFQKPGQGEMIFTHRAVAGDYEGRDVRGKIVLTADGGPDGIRRAEERGALAHVHIWPSDEPAIHEMIATPVWGTPTPETAPSIPKIPALGVTNADGERLAQADGPLAAPADWAPGDRLLTPFAIPWPGTAAGPLTVRTGLYTYPGLERLRLTDGREWVALGPFAPGKEPRR